MRKRLVVFLSFALVVVALGLLLHPREPAYGGRNLSDWIVALKVRPGDAQTRTVVRELGSNSIPVLLDWLQREDRPTLKGRIEQAKEGGIHFLEGHRLIMARPRSGTMDWKSSYRSLALRAFEEIGPSGKEAIPALIQMLGRKSRDTNEFSAVAGAAWLVLEKMAPASIPPLIDALSSADNQVWGLAASALGRIGPDAGSAVPVLQKRLTDPNPLIVIGAANAIGRLGGDPGLFMPMVVEGLRDPDLTFLDYKIEVLLRYKDHAKAAVPALLNILTNLANLGGTTNGYVREQVKDALRQIDPKRAIQPGIE